MSNTFVFEAQAGTGPKSSFFAPTATNGNAEVFGGVPGGGIQPGELVFLRMEVFVFGPPQVWLEAGLTPVYVEENPDTGAFIYRTTATYYGTITFPANVSFSNPTGSVKAYVFGPEQSFSSSPASLLLFDDNVFPDSVLLNAVQQWNQAGNQFAPVNEPACFLHGTEIATPNGMRAIETLSPGDIIISAQGAPISVAWIGRRTVSTRFGSADRLLLVRIAQGALGRGIPARNLTLTADHALLIDGLLVNAGALVNATSITHVPLSELGDSYTVYHIETKGHEVILAEGAPAETYIDYVGRQAFDNYAEYLALYGAEQRIVENAAPRVTSARHLPASLRARLGTDRAA
jgi:hypothetical protein